MASNLARSMSNPFYSSKRVNHRWTIVKVFLVMGFLLFPISGEAGFYSWKDENGKTHFTDDPSQVPPEYREDGKGFKKHRGLKTLTSPDEPSSSRTPTRNRRKSKSSQEKNSFEPSKAGEFEYEVPLIPHGENFLVKTLLNGKVEALLVLDTGASSITISKEIAKKIGWRKDYKTPELPFNTAGGTVWSPVLAIDAVELNGAEVLEVEASINDAINRRDTGMDGLLGMTYLGAYKVTVNKTRSVMILQPLGEPYDALYDGKPGSWWKSRFETFDGRIKFFKEQVGLLARMRHPKSSKYRKVIDFLIKMKRDLEKQAVKAGVPRRYRS